MTASTNVADKRIDTAYISKPPHPWITEEWRSQA
jgi:hypothetical protein